MELHIALALIQQGIDSRPTPQRWVDLGAGSGFFTRTLAGLLPAGSTVTAIDRSRSIVNDIPNRVGQSTIEKRSLDFTYPEAIPGSLDGILMANALLYVRQPEAFLTSLPGKLNAKGRIIIVEYDTDTANPWIPYPISYATLSARFEHRFNTITKIGVTPSAFRRASIYAALLIP